MQTFLGRAGQAILLVLMVMLLLMMLSSTLGTLTHHQYQNVFKEEYSVRTFHAAEAGIETTIAKIKSEHSWYESFPLTGVGGNYTDVFAETPLNQLVSYEVSAQKHQQEVGTSVFINSMGRYRTGDGEPIAQKTLQSTVGVFEAGDYFKGLTVLPGDQASLELHGNLELDGDLLMCGAVRITGSTVINGKVYASGSVTGIQAGARRSNYSFIPPFPGLDVEYYLNNAAATRQVSDMDTSFGSGNATAGDTGGEDNGFVTAYNGIYFVKGDVNIGGIYRGTALIFATGNVTVTSDLEPEPGDDGLPDNGAGSLALVALGDVNIQEYNVYANILAGRCLRARGGASLYGAACAMGVNFMDGDNSDVVNIHIQDNLAPLDNFMLIETKIVEWKELYPVF